MPPNAPTYRFDPLLGRFRELRTGHIMSSAFVRAEVDAMVRGSSREVAALMAQLRSGAIGVEEFEIAMREEVKLAHTAASIVAKGGREQMTQADFGRLGSEVKYQYTKLAAFADGLADGSVRPDGRATRRADLYAQAPRATFHAVERLERAVRAFDLERSILHPADHCDTCVSQAQLGWQPIGQMIPIGERACLTNCRCTAQYKNSQTGQIAA